MKRISVAIAIATAVIVVQAGAALAQTSLPAPDQAFMIEAARAGIAEVELGRLAMQRAASEPVRQFAQRMATEHGAANQELMQLAVRKGMTLPQEMGPEQRAAMDRLAPLSGPSFDEAYMAEMMKAHRMAATLFGSEAQSGQDAELRTWASSKIPTINEHHRLATTIHMQLARGPAAPVAVVTPAPALPAPSASPATVTTVVTTTPAPPFCGGAYLPGVGTNFGGCPR
jgi:putative membrane protein